MSPIRPRQYKVWSSLQLILANSAYLDRKRPPEIHVHQLTTDHFVIACCLGGSFF